MKRRTTAAELKNRANVLNTNGITTREAYLEALPLLFELQVAAAGLAAFSKSLAESANAISEGAAAYAKEHAKALDVPLREVAAGKTSGSVTIGSRVYTLTLTDGPLRRSSGDNMTQEFLDGLPKGWTKTERKLDVTAINLQDVSEEDLFKHGLIRVEKRTWTMKPKAEGS